MTKNDLYEYYKEHKIEIFRELCLMYEDCLSHYLQGQREKMIDVKEAIKYYEKAKPGN